MVGVSVNEYLSVGFEEVCRILEGLTADPVRPVSQRLASLPVRLPDHPATDMWGAAELRIINVQSGTHPLTEILLVVPGPVSAQSARRYVHDVAQLVENSASGNTSHRGRGAVASML